MRPVYRLFSCYPPWAPVRLAEAFRHRDHATSDQAGGLGRRSGKLRPAKFRANCPIVTGLRIGYVSLIVEGQLRELGIAHVSAGDERLQSGTREAAAAGAHVHRPGGSEAVSQGGPAESGSRRPTVLICDDESRLGALTAGLLSEYGFRSVTVGTAEDALKELQEGDVVVDVLLLDVNLSQGSSARDVLRQMGSVGSQARVILTSGLAEEDVDPELISHPSVVAYVAKPYAVEHLVQSIRKALGGPNT